MVTKKIVELLRDKDYTSTEISYILNVDNNGTCANLIYLVRQGKIIVEKRSKDKGGNIYKYRPQSELELLHRDLDVDKTNSIINLIGNLANLLQDSTVTTTSQYPFFDYKAVDDFVTCSRVMQERDLNKVTILTENNDKILADIFVSLYGLMQEKGLDHYLKIANGTV